MSDAPFASTSTANGLEPRRSMSNVNNRRPGAGAATRRKGKGRGRQMMLKIFYALNSPRFPSPPSSNSNANAPPSAGNALSPDFLAVLDPALAPSPDNVPTPASSTSAAPTPAPASKPPSQYTCMARLSTPVWVQMVGSSRRPAGPQDAQQDRNPQFGRVTLKTCLSAICISRPELVIDSTKDYSVAAVDPYESLHQQTAGQSGSATGTSNVPGRPYEPVDALVEGKGMLSWTLAEKKEGTTMVCGRVMGPDDGGPADLRRPSKRRRIEAGSQTTGEVDLSDDDESESDEPEETLEIWLQLTERDAFTQGQFLDCLRSYHNPIQQIQSQLSEMNSSPPKRRDSCLTGPVASTTSDGLFPPLSTSSGDPVKAKRPRERVPIVTSGPAPFATSASVQAASSPAELQPLSQSAEMVRSAAAQPLAAALPTSASANGLQDPRTLALLEQLLPTLTGQSVGSSLDSNGIDISQAQALLPAIETLARFYGIGLPPSVGNDPAATLATPAIVTTTSRSSEPKPTSAVAEPLQQAAAPAVPAPAPAAVSSNSRRAVQATERFVAIDVSHMTALQREQVGKQNPRDPRGGCANCKRRKSTTWHEGRDKAGTMTSVCNACGTFFNKNGYHRTKAPAAPSSSAPGPRSGLPGTSPPRSRAKVAGSRPLQGRLTATCEADLVKRTKPKKARVSPTAAGTASIFATGLVPPLSPSKHVGPRSPSLSFAAAAFGHPSSPRKTLSLSSPGRSPRMRYRNVSNPFAATSPVRGAQARRPDRGNGTAAGGAYESDGEERGPNPLEFGSLFGMETGSPSPVRTSKSSTGKEPASRDMPSYLLTASPGTALDRILNETNIGSISAYDGGAASGKRGSPNLPDASAVSDFSFFLQQPGSPTFGKGSSPAAVGKENAHPSLVTSSTDPAQPVTDADSFENVLSSLRRDFNNRLSSNALTAPSSPAPSSPCVLPRTSTATPGSKGKAPQSSGRPAPSIVDSFLDGVVPAFALDASAEAGPEKTPASDSDAWSPLNAQAEQDTTLRLGDGLSHTLDHSQARASNRSRPPRRAAFIPAHLLAPSDATDVFDLGSLPPSSPPMLPSDAFPTPSDFEGVTPSADGGEQPTTQQGMLEAVAETVSREPNADTRQAMVALLQSLSAGSASGGQGSGDRAAHSFGSEEAKVQLDRETVSRLLGLISARETSTGSTTQSATAADSNADINEAALTALNAPASVVTGGQQMHDLYHDLFTNPPF